MGSQSHPYLRFALISLALVLVIAGGSAFIGTQLVNDAEEAAAAQSTRDLAAAPLRELFVEFGEGELSSSDRNLADFLAAQLVTDQLQRIRVWSAGGTQIYEFPHQPDAAAVAAPRGSGLDWARRRAVDGAPLFVVVDHGAPTIELARDPATIDSAIAGAQRDILILVALFATIGYAASQAAYAIATRRYEAGYRRLLYLYTTGQKIRSSLDLQEVLTQLSRDATGLARGRYGLIALYDQDTGDLMLRATFDQVTGTFAHHQRAVEEWFLRRCVATNTTIVSEQPVAAYRQLVGPELDVDGQIHVLCVPMSLRERVVGVVTVLRQGSVGGFAASEVRWVEELAGQAVMAVEQATLFAKVRSYADELEMSYDTTLKVLMAALDTKDDVTEGHCERVAKLTVQLARSMGIPESMHLDMERGALLHDVGKIGVPDEVLKKPKSLNSGEWEAMRKHPLLAGLLVSKVGFLEPALPILLYHHERYDGTGYPFGLSGDSIPLEARIFAIVDAYDAMTQDRPYRDAMTHHAAMDEIRDNNGTQFDPDVVAAFEQLMAAKPEYREKSGRRVLGMHDIDDAPRGEENVA
jgi:HD-GYP domain-containing protein (c-di-GMP phosphodiesterase class II)